MRLRLVAVLALVAAAAAAAWGVHMWRVAHPPPPPPAAPVGAIYKVAENLYAVPGGGGTTAVFIHEKGVLLVDTKLEAWYQAMIDQVRTVTDKPITHAINTHLHGDHAGGNKFLPDGVEIVVQENTGRYLEKWNNVHGHPLRTFKDHLTLFEGKDAVDLHWFGPAHTDGDAIVVFREARVMHVGDLFPNKQPPVINRTWGGNGLTYADTLDKAVAGIKDVDRVITGHGPTFTWADLKDFAEFNHALLEHARSVVASKEDRHAAWLAWKVPEKFKGYEFGKAEQSLEQIYLSLEQ